LEIFVKEINQEMKKYMGNEIIENLTPDFTTTDINTKLVCQMSIMDSFKKFFDFELHVCMDMESHILFWKE